MWEPCAISPRRWGWLVGLEAARLSSRNWPFFRSITALTAPVRCSRGGRLFLLVFYAAVGGLGIWIARRKSLPKIVVSSLTCSFLFYVISNTFSWWHDVAIHMTPGYPATLAGWWQANTVGLPGLPPTWLFLRNGMAGDLFFVLLLLLVLDRGFLFGQASAKTVPRTA